ncbi:MAG: hypothetical protein KC492_19620, partial [Myxococcales bacterium]|nr:hypothetical protein [Myxococcales bacterium]
GYSLKLLEDDEGTLVLRRGKRILRKYRVQETDGDTVYYCAPTKRLIVVQATDPATAHDEHSAYSHTVITY